MRNAFIQGLVEFAKTHDNIALVVGDLGYSVIEPFVDSFPDRFVNAGVAEQNMAGLAAGMASEGYHVFTYSIANFPTFRCAEQLRNDVDHHRLAVTTVAVGGGVAYGNMGYSHHAVQDYALMRTMPNMVIAAPGDPFETSACLRYLIDNPGPSYLRLGKAGEPCFHNAVPDVAPGYWVPVQTQDRDRARVMISTGAALGAAIQRSRDSGHAVWSMPLWSMASKRLQQVRIAPLDEVVTLEDHLIDGGFGSWMSESLIGTPQAAKLRAIALSEDVCDAVASQAALNRLGGLTV
ncbi:transketolase family protein [Novosphingobium sp.]|uniref:transketolase family protein n=1 Tax=Novosphingobium sp. TaxID=1874826 RepID=UPI003D0D7A52